MLGKLLDRRYQVIQVLGAGGFGRTYLARDTRRPGNPICVVKHLKPLTNEPSFLETARRLFSSEAETLEQLGSHDQIPRLLAYFEEDQEFYLVQEFVEGHTLSQELQPGQRWTESQAIELLQEVLTILAFVHNHGVIHRDIKPDNLIRRDLDKKLVLVDFGAVKQVRTQLAGTYAQTNNTVAVGTPGYMSSEQARGQPRPSSDIYALGIIGIQALTGVPPMQLQEDLNTGEILWQHFVPVNPRLAAILSKMVRYHFKDRYQSATEVLTELRAPTTSPSTPYPTAPVNPSANDGLSRQPFPQPSYPSPLSERQTLAAAPAPAAPVGGVAQPDYPSRSSSRSNQLPLVIGLSVVIAAVTAFSAVAIRQLPLTDWLSGDRNSEEIDASACTVTTGLLNVRSGPGTNNNVVNTVGNGTQLALTGDAENGWVEIRSPVRGWVFNDARYIDCAVAEQTPPEEVVTQPPVQTPAPQQSPNKPKPDNGLAILARAAQKYQQGDFQGAIADAQSIPNTSPAHKDALAKIAQWQQEWTTAKTKFDEVQQALNEGRWTDVIAQAADPNLLKQDYWREQLSKLVEEARRRQAEVEANQVEPTPYEEPKPQPTGTVQPSPEAVETTTPSPASP